MSDVNCPYCDCEIELTGGEDWEELDELDEHECPECGKGFVFTTEADFYHIAYKAPCLNGEPHKWKKIDGFPEEYYKNKYRCEYCNQETEIKED